MTIRDIISILCILWTPISIFIISGLIKEIEDLERLIETVKVLKGK